MRSRAAMPLVPVLLLAFAFVLAVGAIGPPAAPLPAGAVRVEAPSR